MTIDKIKKILREGESIYIPLGSKHRLENYGVDPLLLVEVQTGTYFGEDDIIRFKDFILENNQFLLTNSLSFVLSSR